MRLDLHIHTTASDGAWTPEEVVRGAAAGGLDVIAIADHDTVDAFAAASASAPGLNVQVVPALEVSSTRAGRDVHVLGYFVDPDAQALRRHRERASERREKRMREMVGRLAGLGFEVSFDAVQEAAGVGHAAIGRPHLARALVGAGHATSVQDAFDRLIGDSAAAFVPTGLLEPEDAVELVIAAGGIPVWAHPPADMVDGLLPTLVRRGLRGLEVYRPTHRRDEVLRLEARCRASGLLVSGGSDWHGPHAGAALGDFFVEAREVEKLLAAGGM